MCRRGSDTLLLMEPSTELARELSGLHAAPEFAEEPMRSRSPANMHEDEELGLAPAFGFDRTVSLQPTRLSAPRKHNDEGLRRPPSFKSTLKGMNMNHGSSLKDLFKRTTSTPEIEFVTYRQAHEQLFDWPQRNEANFLEGVRQLKGLDFDALSFSGDDLCHLALEILIELKVDKTLKVEIARLKRFILQVRKHMFDNPYHNWTHVCDVLQAVYALLVQSGLLSRLSSLEVSALVVGALCHDLEHPGVTNVSLLKNKPGVTGRLYEAYTAASSLEKHHTLRAMSLMVHDEVELLSGLEHEEEMYFRDLLSSVILSTDMGRHKDFVSQLSLMANADNAEFSTDMNNQLVMQLLMKCADMSNVFRPIDVAKKWAVCVTDEFFQQGDLEMEDGMPASPNCDRRTNQRVQIQKRFLDFVIIPFYAQISKAVPAMKELEAAVLDNRMAWDACSDGDLYSVRFALNF